MKDTPTIYIITKITNLEGEDRHDGRYPLRIGRRFSFGLGGPNPFGPMFLCYRPRQNEEYSGTLHTSFVKKVQQINKGMVVTTQNSIYYFQEEEM